VIGKCVVTGIPYKDYREIVTAMIVSHEEQNAVKAAVHQPILTLQAADGLII
jgi:hypothetical protein